MPSSPLSASIVGRKHSPWPRNSPKNSARDSAGTLPDTVTLFLPVTNISQRASNNSPYLDTLTSILRGYLLLGSGRSFLSATFVTENILTLFWEPHADRIDHAAQTQDASEVSL